MLKSFIQKISTKFPEKCNICTPTTYILNQTPFGMGIEKLLTNLKTKLASAKEYLAPVDERKMFERLAELENTQYGLFPSKPLNLKKYLK